LGWRQRLHAISTGLYGPGGAPPLRWLADTRLAIGAVPTAGTVQNLAEDGVTHIVNCRATVQTWLSQDLAVERALLGPGNVVHAPLWDFGRPQPPRRWSRAVLYAADVIADTPSAGVLVHCQHGRHRSAMIAYAVPRVLGHAPGDADALIRAHHPDAQPLPRYTASVERWLAAGAQPHGALRTGRTGGAGSA
jgi:protein-tyrosine phosphatase